MSQAVADPERPENCRVLIVPHCRACGDPLQVVLSRSGFVAEVVRGSDAAVAPGHLRSSLVQCFWTSAFRTPTAGR